MTRAFFVLALSFVAACGAPEGALTLGTGVEAFEPLPAGASLEVVAGVQGGYHAILSVRAIGIEPGEAARYDEKNPVVDFDVYRDGVRIDDSPALAFGLAPMDDDSFVRLGRRVVLANEHVEPFDAFDGAALTVEVTLEDQRGQALVTSVDVVAEVLR
jgi:hypothetical protein